MATVSTALIQHINRRPAHQGLKRPAKRCMTFKVARIGSWALRPPRAGDPTSALERNYTFRQLRSEGIMPFSDRTLKRIFQDEPGVIPIPCPGGKKKNRKWLVPRHVVERVLTRHAMI